jgi:glycerol-3-phosphate dehydrogenase (NAD(P)+)
LGGVLKNIMAIAAGAVDGFELGDNFKSALMARGLQEMKRFGEAFGAKSETFFGLSGLGDLITTCSSSSSRNWKVGYAISQKKDLAQALQDLKSSVAEGVKTTRIVHDIAQSKGIDMPITREIYAVLYGHKSPREAIESLMMRDLKAEF